MKRTTKIVAASAALLTVGAVALAGTSYAQRAVGNGAMRMGFAAMGAEPLLREIDADRDGKITQGEIDAVVNARFARFDADANGRLSLTEFEALWADITRPVAVRAFQFLDPDGDAGLAKAEIDERFGRLVQRFDRNGDGVLSPEDRGRFGGRGHERGDGDRRDRS